MTSHIRKSTRYGVNTAVMIAIVLGILIIVEMLSYRHGWRKDFTENKRHSLSEQTLNVLHDLKEEIKVTAFVWKGSPVYDEAKSLLDLYAHETDSLKVELVDPDLSPALANSYEVGRYGVPVVFFEGSNGREAVTELSEEQATNALIKIVQGTKKAIYFLTGHGEHDLDGTGDDALSSAKKLLEDKHYDAQPLLLLRAEDVPEDCSVLVVCGPQTDLMGSEIDAIQRYLDKGGRALFLIDPETAPSLKPLTEKYGIVLGDDIIIDRLSRLFGGDYLMPVPTSYSPHAITKNFNVAPFFAVARSVSVRETPGIRATWLMKTGDRSWAETDLDTLATGTASFDPDKDVAGPVSLAAVAEVESGGEGKTTDSGAAITVFGDSDFVTNARVNLSGNSAIFMNTINWLAKEEALIAIPPKESKSSPIVLTASDARLLFILPVLVLPGIILAAGIYVFVRRSRHP